MNEPTIGQVKRALDWWSCSERFRLLVRTDPDGARREFALDFNPDLIRFVWDPPGSDHPSIRAYHDFVEDKRARRARIRSESAPDEPRFKAWRARQIARNRLDSGGYDDDVSHAPVAIELADGCSVGCWFCGVSAGKLAEVWRYTDANAALWRDVVSVLRATIGEAARWGLLYWATDPLDNPDYEQFALDFSRITGTWPQTTTALGHTNPPRIRRLLEMSQERGCRINRFSVLTGRQLRQIFTEYDPEELTHVEIVPQMKGGAIPRADAGAFRLRAKTAPAILDEERRKLTLLAAAQNTIAPPQAGTIACVSGFLLNMVRRSVKLVSPCRATEQWPLGYVVYDERTFRDADDLNRQLAAMIASRMPLTIDPDDRIQLNPALTYTRVADGFQVTTPMNGLSFSDPNLAGYVGSIGDRVSGGQKTAGQIAFSALFEHGVPETDTLTFLSRLFAQGVVSAERSS